MRAYAVRELRGTPEMMDLPKPSPGPGEILIHLGAASINPLDMKIVGGVYEGKRPHVFPLILGVDGAGVVEALGEGARRFKVGDGVFGQLLGPKVGTGTYAEFTAVPESLAISAIPRGIYTGPAASIPTAGMTALVALDALGLKKGQTLAIVGATGGVGSFATQLASNSGILVVALAKGDQGTWIRKLGAFEYHDASRIGYEREFRFAHPNGVDAVLDLVHPGAEAEASMGMVRDGGTFASTIGAVPEGTGPRGIRTLPINLPPSTELLDRLSKEISTGRIRVPMESQRPLAEAPQVFEQIRSGGVRGKIALLI